MDVLDKVENDGVIDLGITSEETFEDQAPYGNNKIDLGYTKPVTVDATLILGAERTLFAALNNAWLLAIGGIGLMSVGNGDTRATLGGASVLSFGISSALLAYLMHIRRCMQIQSNGAFLPFTETMMWSSVLVAMSLVALGMELYFGILHPYLDREKAVTIVGDTGGTIDN